MPLVLTDAGVEDCPLLDPKQLDELACWLCHENNYHDRLEKWAGGDASEEAFERQVKANGGYCNVCRDFAGTMLARYHLETRR